MRTQEEILNNPRITPALITEDGCKGTISVGGWLGSVIWSTGAGWDHVSVAPFKHKITPSWDDMCKVKEIFFRDDEAVIQIHPPKDQEVNNLENCLHLWRCTRTEMVLPPSVLVGLRKGQTMAEARKELEEAYALVGEKL